MHRALLRLALLPVLAAGLLSGLVGCGHSHGVKPRTWAGDVCQALAPWRAQITTLNAQAAQDMGAASNPQQTRESLVKLLSGAQAASEQARVLVERAGAPDVTNGDAIAARFVRALAQVRDAYAKAEQSIVALALEPAKTFYDGVAHAIDTLNTEYAAAGVNTTTLASEPLRKEFDEVPACNPG